MKINKVNLTHVAPCVFELLDMLCKGGEARKSCNMAGFKIDDDKHIERIKSNILVLSGCSKISFHIAKDNVLPLYDDSNIVSAVTLISTSSMECKNKTTEFVFHYPGNPGNKNLNNLLNTFKDLIAKQES